MIMMISITFDTHELLVTSLCCETKDMGLVRYTVCLFTPLLLAFIAPTHGGMARLS